jgi:hypothetical protein
MADLSSQEQAVPIRQWDGKHGAPDALDPQRVLVVRRRLEAQAPSRLERDRAIEENVRMLAGRQWDVWSPVLGQFVDPFRYLDNAERRWRQRPVVNLLAYWFLLTHARLTESQPVISFQPSTADRLDQALAETMDVVCKTLWQGSMDMDGNLGRAAAWLLAGGECYFETCIEYGMDAPQYALTGPATLSMQREDGSMIERDTSEDVPYGPDGNALASLVPEGDDYGYNLDEGEGATVREGDPKCYVYGPLEVWSEWGANKAWEDKQWISCRRYLSVEQVKDIYGVDVTPDVVGNLSGGDLVGGAGTLQRMLFGSGYFGSTNDPAKNNAGYFVGGKQTVFCTVDAMWEKPCGAYPQGRMLVVAAYSQSGGVVLHDSVRPFNTRAAGPIRRAQFIQMPGRAGFGTTPLEQLVPIQKSYNRGWGQILEHRNRCSNPILIYDSASGFNLPDKNVPGASVEADFSATNGNPPAVYLVPPPLSGDVWRVQSMLFDLVMRLGSLAGAEGTPQTDDPSGELVNQLRFNADRPISVAARSLGMALAGVGEDLSQVLKVAWPAEKVITYAGEDNLLQTVTVTPELWSGSVNVHPDLANAIGETPAAKQARLERLLAEQVIDRTQFLEMAQLPGLKRLSAGPDRVTIEKLIVMVAQGAPAAQVQPILKPWYNYDVFLSSLRNYLAAPEFLRLDEGIQAEFGQFFEMVIQARAMSQQFQAQAIVAPQTSAQAQVQGETAKVAQAHAPPPPAASEAATGPKSGPSAPAGAQAA